MNRPVASVGLALALVLAGCAQRPATLEPPTGTINALVAGPVESAFLEPLRSTVKLVQYDGSQKSEDYDLVILDGDHHAPAALREDALVQEALGTGKWVLMLDAAAGHKREGLGAVIQAASGGVSPAYAVHRGRDARGRLEVRVVEFPAPSEVLARQGGNPTNGVPGEPLPVPPPVPPSAPFGPVQASVQDTDSSSASAFANALLTRIRAPIQAQGLPPGIPDDLIYATFYFSQVQNWQVGNGGRHPGSQHPNFTANYTFSVFLNNKANPQGDFQWVLLDADVSASPKNASEGFVAPGTRDSTVWNCCAFDEWGWFQDRVVVQVQPSPDDWVKVDTSPDTVNGSRTVTTGVNFSIGFNQAQGGNASFGFSESTSRNITDWKVTNASTGKVAWWYYRTNYPLDADYDQGCNGAQYIWHDGCYILPVPNDLSTSSLSLRTQAVWRTPQPVDGWVDFGVWNEHGMIDLYCGNNFGFGCSDPKYQSARIDPTTIYSVNLGAVLPVPIASLTFNPNPARATVGTQIQGTVTLSKTAQMDTEIKLSSNSQNATVLPKVTVKQGQTSATFAVLINPNGLVPGGSTVATITAFYAQDFQAQLTVQN